MSHQQNQRNNCTYKDCQDHLYDMYEAIQELAACIESIHNILIRYLSGIPYAHTTLQTKRRQLNLQLRLGPLTPQFISYTIWTLALRSFANTLLRLMSQIHLNIHLHRPLHPKNLATVKTPQDLYLKTHKFLTVQTYSKKLPFLRFAFHIR